MLNYRIIENKSTIKTEDGDQYIDLLSENLNENAVLSGAPLIVNKHYVARPDLISLALYGDDRYGDIICKLNGISNPFELNEDMLIYVPSIENAREIAKGSSIESEIISKEENEEIAERTQFPLQKMVSDKRKPNEQIIGDRTYVIDKSLGLVFY